MFYNENNGINEENRPFILLYLISIRNFKVREACYCLKFVDLQKPTRSSKICMRNPSVLLMIWCAQTSTFVIFCLILIENPNSHLGSLRLCMRSLKCESYEAIRFLAEGDDEKKKYKKDGVRGCLVCVFK